MGSGRAAAGRGTKIMQMILLMWCCSVMASAQSTPKFNVTTILAAFPNFSVLNKLLSSTGVAQDINSRQSLTLLAPSDDALTAFQNSNQNFDSVKMGDLLRFHVLLQFFTLDQLKALPTVNQSSITTLLQATGRANGDAGVVNIFNTQNGVLIGPAVNGTGSNVTAVTNITSSGFDLSVIQSATFSCPLTLT